MSTATEHNTDADHGSAHSEEHHGASDKQYIVIACGGGKNGAPSGGVYVAFALP